LFKREASTPGKPLRIDKDKCTGCRLCLGLGCPPITWKILEDAAAENQQKVKLKRDGIAIIERNLCTGCGLCRQLCTSGAIIEEN
jgi:indolepyruvate ferredoxin oxidoreductase, alpha subunit